MKNENAPPNPVEQKLIIVKDDGHSFLLVGELETKRPGQPSEDILPSYLNMGWAIVNMTPFSSSGAMMVLLQKQSPF